LSDLDLNFYLRPLGIFGSGRDEEGIGQGLT